MKNNFITKIIGATLAFAMMIGGAVGINVAKQAKEVNAATATYKLTIDASDFNTTSYAANNNEKTSNAVCTTDNTKEFEVKWTSNQVMKNSNNMQWKKSEGYIYNSTDLGTITNVTVTSSAGSFTTYYGTTEHPTSGTTVGNGFFTVKVGSSTGTTSKIEVTFNIVEGGPQALANPNPQYNNSTKVVSWTIDANASGYQIKIDSGEYSDINTSTYNASSLTKNVPHTVYIKAVGDGVSYSSTEGSVTFTPFDGKDFALCTSVNDLEVGAKYIFTSDKTGTVKAMSTEENANNRKTTSVSVDAQSHRISSTIDTLVLELGGSNDNWTFHTDNYAGTNGYLASASSGDSNYLRVQETAYTATIGFSNEQANVVIQPHSSRNKIRFNSSLFACYSSGQDPVYLWKEYKELDHLSVTGSLEKTAYYDSEEFSSAGLTISAVYADSSSKVLAANEVNWESLTAGMTQIRGSYTENGITKYTQYFNITVAADSLSSVTLSGTMGASYYLDAEWNPGTLAVTANYASDTHITVTNEATIAYFSDSAMQNEVATPADLGVGQNQTVYVKATYNAVSNTVGYAQTVTISVEPGTTENNPLTVAAAVEIGNALEHNAQTSKEYYIQGVVSQIVENNLNANTKKATFWLQNGDVAQGFEVYQISPANGCTNYTDFREGAEVLIKCQIKRYNSIIETGTAKSLLSITYTAPEATDITLNRTSLNIETNDTFQLTFTLSPLGAEGNVNWSSNNESVATVSDSGLITAIAKGSAKITAQVSENVKAECNVIVAEPSRSANKVVTVDLTNGASVSDTNFELTIEAESKTGYYQDGSGTEKYFVAKAETPLFVCEPTSIIFTARLGAGSAKNPLEHNVEACLVDNQGNEINSTKTVVANALPKNPENFTIELPYSANAYGFKLMHTKEASFNARYYSFSLSYKYSDTFAVLSGNETNEGVDQVKMTFGATVSVATWNSLETAYGTITDYGVMMFKTTSALSSDTPVQDRFKVNGALANFHKGSAEISSDGDIYKFSAYVSFSDNTKYGTTVCAAPYIVANGVYYFLGEIQYSVNTLAQYHLQNGGSNLSTEALNVLAGN